MGKKKEGKDRINYIKKNGMQRNREKELDCMFVCVREVSEIYIERGKRLKEKEIEGQRQYK